MNKKMKIIIFLMVMIFSVLLLIFHKHFIGLITPDPKFVALLNLVEIQKIEIMNHTQNGPVLVEIHHQEDIEKWYNLLTQKNTYLKDRYPLLASMIPIQTKSANYEYYFHSSEFGKSIDFNNLDFDQFTLTDYLGHAFK